MHLRQVLFLSLFFLVASADGLLAQSTLNGHPVKLDSEGKLISWVEPQAKAYDTVMRLAWDFLLHKVLVEDNGLKTYFTSCCIYPPSMHFSAWPNNPAFVAAQFIDSALAYYAYSGDRAPVELARSLADYGLAHGTTPAGWAWARVPYASSNHLATEFRGADSFMYSADPGRGDGYGFIEPDKVGELGFGYLRLHEWSASPVYLEAAIACAGALAAHVREGDAEKSPWPFRVNAETNVIEDEYSANVLGPIRLFDELIRLHLGNVAAYQKARDMAWAWMMKYPIKNNAWSGIFEDIPNYSKPVNYNQYSPMETARYLMQHPEYDADWKKHVPALIDFVEKTFVFVEVKNEPGVQWGANAVSEQIGDMNKMGSHTSRYASINAMWYELTGDTAAQEKAFRSFNWATYMCSPEGLVKVGPVDQSLWFSDGYADYIRHFMSGLGAVPEWAPPQENHLLRSTSVIVDAEYEPHEVRYSAFDPIGIEVLRLAFKPKKVMGDGNPLVQRDDLNQPGWQLQPDGVVRIRRDGAKTVRIVGQ